MGMDGGGKLPYSYGAGGGHHDAKLKSLSRVEPRKFGIGLVAGFLLVTCAYFSTAKFDAIHIAMMSPADEGAAGIGSLVKAADGSKQHELDLGLQDREALSREGSWAEVLDTDDDRTNKASASSWPDSGRSAGDDNGGRDASPTTAPHPAAVALLPPVSSSEESANSTQESGVLEDEELQVQDAIANATRKASSESSSSSTITSSNGASSPPVVPSDPAVPLPAPVKQLIPPLPSSEVKAPAKQQIPPLPSSEVKAPAQQQIPPLPSSEVKAPAQQQIPPVPEIKQADSGTPVREWKPLCDVTSNFRTDWCELDGDVRVIGANATVTLVASPVSDTRTFREESWRIKPYPRKADPNAMRHIRELTVRSAREAAPACTDRHDVPALVFSERGYTGNYFHAYTDVILPLFLTARRYAGEVRLLVTDFQMWWLGKFMPVFRSLSNYELVDLDADPRVHCFRHVQVGLTAHGDFSIDPTRAPNGYTMRDFTRFMRGVYGLPRHVAFSGSSSSAGGSAAEASASASASKGENTTKTTGGRPRLLVIARARTRRFVNTDEIVRGAEKVGFEVVVSEGEHEVAPFAELANSCDAIVGVHGAGLTNMVFLPTGGVVIQVVPIGGLDFVVGYFRYPSRDMGLRYLEYRIKPEESTLIDRFPRDHPIFTDPRGVTSKGWESLKDAYLDKQDVRLDMRRFRPTLKKAIAHLRRKAKNSNNN